MRAAPFALFAIAAMLASCAEAPFVDHEIESLIDKRANTITTNGTATICHADSAPWAEVEAEAAYACGEYGYFSQFQKTLRYQCRITAPHQSTFTCYHPEMTDAKGRLINPADEKAIAEWQKRTGKMKPKPRIALPQSQQQAVPATLPSGPMAPAANPVDGTPTGTAAPIMAAPAATPPVAPYRPLTPADIAGKPDMAPAPILTAPPSQAPLYPSGGSYTLPPGSWGQHFEE
ncbi:hypothetical protein [Magnetospirillum gryphiswaldense]|uniref:Secreted protein n=1 Tax=Magnetospirillum gryphiswaldense TaxID=55518 RepID=A4TYJ8_9PROT|nr:hypothetical protein [Magnetospirillum gryphiswaldense]AVM74695.1 hypothetical protein MSR1_22100 [Magnetospirillum gryphiswaldense MSR-1]AVM78598.1 hypothetical protein MSR1L_22100 [Magnetospirillum gryphiswaldense]CAM75705.1 secreted protein [Magnetospirillum gryphiswaldense MSR-1]